MAFIRGSQINPALGRTDFTPFLQGSLAGSQMAAQGAAAMGQGLAGLMSGVGQGIDAYKKNKEETKRLEGFLKAADKMSAGFEPIMDKIDPRIGQSIQQMRQMIGDPNLSVKERASAAQAFLQQAPVLLNSGIQFMDKQNEAAATNQRAIEAAMQMQAKQAELAAKQAEAQRKQQIETGVAQWINTGGQMPQGVDSSIAPLVQAQGAVGLAELQAKQTAARPKAEDFRVGKNGEVEIVPGSKADLERKDKAEAKETEKKLAEDRIRMVRESAANTLQNVIEAYNLAKTDAGGPIAGLPVVRDVLAFGSGFIPQMGGAKRLSSQYDTIKSALAIDRLQEMRTMSRTGSTPFGQLAGKELDVVQNSIAKLDPSLPEDEQRQNLQKVANALAKIAGVEAPKLGAQPRPNTLKGGSRAPASQRYQIVQ